jgi:hypothetical protein
MQQQGTGPVKSQALPIIWEEDYNFAEWEKILVWRELLQGHDIPNGEAALKALMPREVARALDDIAAVEVNLTSRSREAISALYAAERSCMPLTPASSEAWQAIEEYFTVDYGFSFDHSWKKMREVLDAWREESPVEFKAWKEAVEEACTLLKTWRAAYTEIENLFLDLRISPDVKVGSGWEADMNLKLLKVFNSLLDRAKAKAFNKAGVAELLFRTAEESFRFFPTMTLIHEIYSED